MHGRKSVICKFVQAKLKAIARRRAAAKCAWFRDINDGVVANLMPENLGVSIKCANVGPLKCDAGTLIFIKQADPR